MNKVLYGGLAGLMLAGSLSLHASAAGYEEIGEFGRPGALIFEDSDEQIAEEIRLGEMELLAQLVEAEAGNQSFEGKCLVVDCILNRVESSEFPDTITEVIYQKGQFSVAHNGRLEKAGWHMQESDYEAVQYEMELHENKDVLYFNNCPKVAGTGEKFKVGGHWFRNG